MGSARPGRCRGFEVAILRDEGLPVQNRVQGNIALKMPLPPGCLTGIWGKSCAFP